MTTMFRCAWLPLRINHVAYATHLCGRCERQTATATGGRRDRQDVTPRCWRGDGGKTLAALLAVATCRFCRDMPARSDIITRVLARQPYLAYARARAAGGRILAYRARKTAAWAFSAVGCAVLRVPVLATPCVTRTAFCPALLRRRGALLAQHGRACSGVHKTCACCGAKAPYLCHQRWRTLRATFSHGAVLLFLRDASARGTTLFFLPLPPRHCRALHLPPAATLPAPAPPACVSTAQHALLRTAAAGGI